MRRGDVVTVAGGKDYAGKPRPAVVIQDDSFHSTGSITLCAFTTDDTEAPILRLVVAPSDGNGLKVVSRLMVDKVTTVPKSKIGGIIGRLSDGDIVRLNQSLLVFLGLANSPKAREMAGQLE